MSGASQASPVSERPRRAPERCESGRSGSRTLPLDGLLVVALEQAVAAPFATRQLADLGARVIKIERPGAGDFARGYDRSRARPVQLLHLAEPGQGERRARREAARRPGRAGRPCWPGRTCSCRTWRPGAAERLGLGADELTAPLPAADQLLGLGLRPGRPVRRKKAYDLLVQCEAGLLSVTGTPSEPAKAGISVADIAAGHVRLLRRADRAVRAGADRPRRPASRWPCWTRWASG